MPLWPRSKSNPIPNILWQTNFSDRVTLPLYLNYCFNRLMSPGYEYRFMDNHQCEAFIRENCPESWLIGFNSVTVGAAKADLWRLMVLHSRGGIYLDLDAHLVWPLGYIVGSNKKELYVKNRDGFTNYFIASRAGNPNLKKMIDLALDNIANRRAQKVYALTGPVITRQVLDGQEVPFRFYRHTCIQGSFTNEYFQYLDFPGGKWTHAEVPDIIRSDEAGFDR